MKIIGRKIHKNQGYVILIPTEIDDFQAIWSLVEVGDVLKGSTIRKTKCESELGLKKTKRVKTRVTIKITKIEQENNTELIRFNGLNIRENKHIPLYAQQSINLEINMKIVIEKQYWDYIALQELNSLADPIKSSELAVAVIEEGMFNLAIIRDSGTHYVDNIQKSIPKKRRGQDKKEDALNKFNNDVKQSILTNLDWSVVKCIVIGSVGVHLRDRIFKSIQEAKKTDNTYTKDSNYDMQKIVLANCSSGQKHSVHEILADANLQSAIGDTKAQREQACMKNFFTNLDMNPEKVAYGFKEVQTAGNDNNIESMMLTDNFLRGKTVACRQMNIRLIEEVKRTGGNVQVLKSLHPAGERLNAMSGIAAILRVPFDQFGGKEWVLEHENADMQEDMTIAELAKYTGEYGHTFAVKFEVNLMADEVTDDSEQSEMIDDEDEI